MDKLKRARAPLRAAVTKLYNELITELNKSPPDHTLAKVTLKKLVKKSEEVTVFDKQILATLLEETEDENSLEAEHECIDEYKDKVSECQVLVADLIAPTVHQQSEQNNQRRQQSEEPETIKKFRLPKLEMQKFGGDLRGWLSFWSMFKKIHEDQSILPEDKFFYLQQAITPGSRAREMVDSYPPTADNYPKVIDSLQKRFGRDELLVEVYVRELLSLVLKNAVNKEKVSISQLFDKLECHMRALETLGVTSEKCAAMLYPLVESCLPEEILRAWQRSSSCLPTPSSESTPKNRLTLLMDFLRTEVEGEERILLARTGFELNSSGREKKQHGRSVGHEDVPTAHDLFSGESNSGNSNKTVNCIFCDKRHASQDCYLAAKMSMNEKKSCLHKRRGCFVCVKVGHQSSNCRSSVKCLRCGKRHVAVMCPELETKKEEKVEKQKNSAPAVNSHEMANLSCTTEVGLQTLLVTVVGSGKEQTVRAIIDSASQRSYILKKTATEVGLESTGEEKLIHTLFGGVRSEQVNHSKFKVQLNNIKNNYRCTIEMLDQTRICHEIPRIQKGPWFEEVRQQNIWLSDMGADCPEIAVLIGADVAGKLLTGKVLQLKSGLTAVETLLGWTVMGKVPGNHQRGNNSCLLVTTLLTAECSTVQDLWRLETIGICDSGESKSRAVMEEAAKQHFLETVKVNSEGRYEVNLPWVEGHPALPSYRSVAEKRLYSATKKLTSDGRMEQYQQVFDEWLAEGIVEIIPEEQLSASVHFLPHRAVVKESSSTTKIRPVFDASNSVKNYPSLNDCLEKGPNLIELIPDTVMRFRLKKIGVISDIKKAFLQICVAERDSNFLCFLWWDKIDKNKIIVYRHRRVVFGASSSPFLLAAVLEYHLLKVPAHLLPTAMQLAESFYVDNSVTSVEDELQLLQFRKEAVEIMAAGKFDLCGWESTWVGTNDRKEEPAETQLLGMLWNKREDTIYCDLRDFKIPEGTVTKRNILSVAHKIFDTVGFTCPVMIHPKILLQESWKLKVGWDAELPDELGERFTRWARDLHLLSEIRIPRWLGGRCKVREDWSLHMFSDASKTAYAACVFLRVRKGNDVLLQLIRAKSRVSPLEKLTIPRLELLSCLIGCRLTESVKKALKMSEIPVYYWTDSSTALSWIQRGEQWATFVGNRVKEIHSLSSVDDWRHVPGVINPADLPSRGCTVKQLIESRWWEGPDWLRKQKSEWPVGNVNCNEEEVFAEKKKTVTSMLAGANGTSKLSDRFSSYKKQLLVIGWIFRFVSKLKGIAAKTAIRPTSEKLITVKSNIKFAVNSIDVLTVIELEAAEKTLLKMVQREAFSDEADKQLKSLSVFTDEEGLLRVKTSISRREDQLNFNFPILLPSVHPVVQCLIREKHLENSHVGVQTLLTMLRENYWIIRGRKTVKSVVVKCKRCQRYEVKSIKSVPVELPLDRVKDAEVFEVTGVDLAGPLYLKGGQKCWIVLYTCAVYRAVHLELVTTLSTDGFLQSLRRFISRRSRPAIIYSDNGTNFVGAVNLFSQIDWKSVERYSAAQRIQWKFNPPSAAWWGGWWERIVRIIKNILRRVLGKSSLTYEDLNTVLCDTEAVINARPLTYVSEDCKDLIPLTPSVFLQERREVGVPDLDCIDECSLQRKYRHRQQLLKQLRERFRSEYLGLLVMKAEAKRDERLVFVGDVVLIGSDNQKRLDWPLAKVLEVIPGRDGNVRTVRLKTATGERLRPIQRVYPLEVSSGDPVADLEEIQPAPEVELEDPVTVPRKVLRTRSGREIKVPVKFSVSFSSFILM